MQESNGSSCLHADHVVINRSKTVGQSPSQPHIEQAVLSPAARCQPSLDTCEPPHAV